MQKQDLEKLIKQLDPNSYRMKLVESARLFKSNWVQFGELLTQVAADKLYTQWGYKDFEEYCREEIRIKKATAIKLTNAYFFVTKADPEIFNYANQSSGLDLDAVNILQKAKNDDQCSPEIYSELRSAALDKGQSPSTLARKFKRLVQMEGLAPDKAFQEQNLQLVNRLRQRIKPLDHVPAKFKEYLEEMADYFSQQEI
jgi:hypothetical protein